MDSAKLMEGVIGNIHRIGGVSDSSYTAIQAVHVAFAMSRSMDKQAAVEQFATCWDQYASVASDLIMRVRGGLN